LGFNGIVLGYSKLLAQLLMQLLDCCLISWKLAIKQVMRDKGDNQSATKLLDKTLSGARQSEHAFPKSLTQEAMKGCVPNEPSNLVGTNLAANWDPPMFIDQDCRETIANH